MEREQEPVQTVKSVFIGEVRRKAYYNDSGYYHSYVGHGNGYTGSFKNIPEIKEHNKLIGEKKFFECDFEVPRLREGESLYINELDITVQIVKGIRSTTGETVYHTTHIVEVLDNEDSKNELQKAQEEHVKYTNLFNKESDQRAEDKLQELVDRHNQDMKNSTWYGKLFGKGSIKL